MRSSFRLRFRTPRVLRQIDGEFPATATHAERPPEIRHTLTQEGVLSYSYDDGNGGYIDVVGFL